MTAAEVATAVPSKTPISLLQELCARRGITPKYDLLSIEGAVHEPTFVYRVSVGELVSNGTGQSKKKAKHAAAKAVLDKLLGQTPEVNGDTISAGDGSDNKKGDLPKVTAAQIVTPYDDGIPGNPVGALQELCMARRWPPPLYELITEKGLPHERSFVMCCTVVKTKERGDAKSKKLAKRQAAYKMLQQLKDLPIKQEPANLFEDEEEDVRNSYNACLECSNGSCPECTIRSDQSHVKYTEGSGPESTTGSGGNGTQQPCIHCSDHSCSEYTVSSCGNPTDQSCANCTDGSCPECSNCSSQKAANSSCSDCGTGSSLGCEVDPSLVSTHISCDGPHVVENVEENPLNSSGNIDSNGKNIL